MGAGCSACFPVPSVSAQANVPVRPVGTFLAGVSSPGTAFRGSVLATRRKICTFVASDETAEAPGGRGRSGVPGEDFPTVYVALLGGENHRRRRLSRARALTRVCINSQPALTGAANSSDFFVRLLLRVSGSSWEEVFAGLGGGQRPLRLRPGPFHLGGSHDPPLTSSFGRLLREFRGSAQFGILDGNRTDDDKRAFRQQTEGGAAGRSRPKTGADPHLSVCKQTLSFYSFNRIC